VTPIIRSEGPAGQHYAAPEFSGGELPSTGTNGGALSEYWHRTSGFLAKKIIVIEARVLLRESLLRAIQATNEMNVAGYGNVEDALEEFAKGGDALFLLSIPGPLKIADYGQTIARLVSETGASVTVLGDGEDLDEIVQMFHLGAVGYISTDLSFEVVVESLRLMLAGGKFIPASILLTARAGNGLQTPALDHYKSMFTERQIAVLGALSIGKANKAIANELQMREGTVKVHVRKLMKMLNARNRTELALIVKEHMRLRQTRNS